MLHYLRFGKLHKDDTVELQMGRGIAALAQFISLLIFIGPGYFIYLLYSDWRNTLHTITLIQCLKLISACSAPLWGYHLHIHYLGLAKCKSTNDIMQQLGVTEETVDKIFSSQQIKPAYDLKGELYYRLSDREVSEIYKYYMRGG